ncbi:MAG: hypothetical protein WCR46_24710 [Deltaproteobacteria bacterium]
MYGHTAEEALKELESVREGFFDVFLEMGKPIPEPIIHLDIPYDVFVGLPEREKSYNPTSFTDPHQIRSRAFTTSRFNAPKGGNDDMGWALCGQFDYECFWRMGHQQTWG